MSEKRKEEEDVKAFLGKGAVFNGKLIFSESVRIDGDFHGEIFGKGTLVVGEGAEIKADIMVNNVAISGDVYGQVQAREKVEIYPSGRLFGDIKAPTLVIREGAIFEGNAYMDPNDLRGTT